MLTLRQSGELKELIIIMKSQKYLFVATRVALGFLMLYAGVSKLMDPEWSAAGYLSAAKTFPVFYSWLLSPEILPTINLINEWGLALLGVSLVLGLFVRLSSVLGAVLMVLYYIPILNFPSVGAHSYIVDEHIIYALLLLYFAAARAGRRFGLDGIITARLGKLSGLLG